MEKLKKEIEMFEKCLGCAIECASRGDSEGVVEYKKQAHRLKEIMFEYLDKRRLS